MSVILKDEVLGRSVRSQRREVPPDVTTGRDVVVVGGTAVGVGAGVDVVVVLVVTVVAPVGGGVVGGELALALEPGCSRATVTPMNAAAPDDNKTMARVRRRRRTSVLARIPVEW